MRRWFKSGLRHQLPDLRRLRSFRFCRSLMLSLCLYSRHQSPLGLFFNSSSGSAGILLVELCYGGMGLAEGCTSRGAVYPVWTPSTRHRAGSFLQEGRILYPEQRENSRIREASLSGRARSHASTSHEPHLCYRTAGCNPGIADVSARSH
jgi:hypothetical protein